MSEQAEAQVKPDEKKERLTKIDFKMVTFSLAGKDYGVDIMGVNEIAKASRFTYVPNAANFVRGVYNLRGDIISVIDLRTMFHLPAEKRSGEALENLLILQVKDHVFGVIVDQIDKVVGISSENIQPPHPIFGDINVKYIRGVVENQNRLYIILDIAKIFAPKEEAERQPEAISRPMASDRLAEAPGAMGIALAEEEGDLDLGFISETLATFKRFGVSEINRGWISERFVSWKAQRPANDLQLKDTEDAEAYLQGFASPFSQAFWGDDYLELFMENLPDIKGKSVSAWNPGCGRGHETYSLAVALRRRYPEARIKIWANDADLLSISMAPNLVFDAEDLPQVFLEYVVRGKAGHSFGPAIRDLISFEYHDVLNSNPLPPVDFILCRDMISYMTLADQGRMLSEFEDKLKPEGLLFLGANERLPKAAGPWRVAGKADISAYAKGSGE